MQQIIVFRDSGLDATQINGLLDLMHRCEYGLNDTIVRSGQKVDAAMYFVREGSIRLDLNRGKEKKTMSVEFRMLMIAMLYPDATQRLGSRANGWRDIFDAPWFANSYSSSELHKLRKQTLPAPRVPSADKANHQYDPESFVHQSSEGFEDLFDNDICGKIAENQQHRFSSFGSQVVNTTGNLKV